MRYNRPIFNLPPRPFHRRSGAILVWCAFVLVILIAMTGLVIDGGLMLAHYRRTQNAADAAALATAYDLMLGHSTSQATTTATAFVTDAGHNNLTGATVVVNIPPSQGPYAGTANFAEVIVTYPLTTYFIQVLPGFNRNQSVTARAVAGIESLSIGEGVMALTPNGVGLDVSGSATLRVNGNILVNSSSSPAATVTGSAHIFAADMAVVGTTNVTGSAEIRNINSGNPISPLPGGDMPSPDRFGYLPTPTVANGVTNHLYTNEGVVSGSTSRTLSPGIYPKIDISGSSRVTLQPGIYVLQGGGLSISGSATVTGNGVMFYNTGKDYNPSTGGPDIGDAADPWNQSAPATNNSNFSPMSLSGSAQVNLTPINNANSPFGGMLYYQRRANNQAMSISGSADNLAGTIYGKWAKLNLTGSMSSGAQFVTSSVKISGSGNVSINYAGTNLGKAPQVYLVE